MTVTLDILLSAVYLAVGTALFVTAVILAVLFHYRITPRIPRIRHNNNWFPPAPINYVIPRQPPPAHFYPPIPPRPPTVDEYPGIIHGRDERRRSWGNGNRSSGRRRWRCCRSKTPPYPAFSRTSHITRSAGATPHPESNYPTAADLARYLVRLGLGTAGPAGSQQPSNLPAVVLGIPQFAQSPNDPHYIYVSSTTELDLVWDNLNIPHAAYFPQREDPDYGTTAESPPILPEDEPVRIATRSPTPPEPSSEPTTELPLQWGQRRLDIPRRRREPPRSVIEVAEELNQEDRDRRQAERERAEIFRRINEGHRGQRIPGIDSRGETIYYTPTDSVASTEQPPVEEGVNGVLHGEAHLPRQSPRSRSRALPQPTTR